MLTNDREIRKINRKWRGKDKATDVLSFPQWSVAELRAFDGRARVGTLELWPLGDIVVSVETAKAQAEDRGESLEAELVRLVVHGFVHLLGYDHELGPREARRMQRVERYLREN